MSEHQENAGGPERETDLDKIQVVFVPISIAALIIIGEIPTPELVLNAAYTLTGGNLAVLVFRKLAGSLPNPNNNN